MSKLAAEAKRGVDLELAKVVDEILGEDAAVFVHEMEGRAIGGGEADTDALDGVGGERLIDAGKQVVDALTGKGADGDGMGSFAGRVLEDAAELDDLGGSIGEEVGFV
jgi:hypothetical protein